MSRRRTPDERARSNELRDAGAFQLAAQHAAKRHEPRLETQTIAFIGRRWRFVCSCPTSTPWMDKESAQHALDRHRWETHTEEPTA